MANPYDTQARAAQGVPYLWDHAYFHGKYYVYFGILPCLVFYVPWLLVTHTGFPTWLGIAICDCVYAAGLMYLLSAVCRRWFPRTSIGVLVVLDVMLFVAGGGIILARTPSMYFMPEAMSLALVSWGLGLWISGTSRGYIERGRSCSARCSSRSPWPPARRWCSPRCSGLRPFLAVPSRLEGRSRGQTGRHGCLQGGDGAVCAGRCRGALPTMPRDSAHRSISARTTTSPRTT